MTSLNDCTLRLATQNVRTLTGKLAAVLEQAHFLKLDILCLQENPCACG